MRAVAAFLIVLALLAYPVLAQDAHVYVQGEVHKPGPIKYTSGLTLGQAVTLAGGPTALASPRRTDLIRSGEETRRVNLVDILRYPAIDVELQPGDIIHVSQRLF